MDAATEQEELTPLHPDYVKVVRLGSVVVAAPLLIGAGVVVYLGLLPPALVLIPAFLVSAYAILLAPVRRYQARGYRLEGDRLRVVGGLLFRHDTVVPFSRVQHLDVEQGPVERLYGLGRLVLHTAGNHNASVTLPGLLHSQAVAIREVIRAQLAREAA